MSRFVPLFLLVALSGGLVGARCGEAEAVSPEELRRDEAPPFDYALYSDGAGSLVGERSAVLLAYRSEHLEHVYTDAQAGNPRAVRLFGQLEEGARHTGEVLADQSQGMVCGALPNCTVRWGYLGEVIPSRGAGGMRLREVLVEGFEWKARRKGVENAVIAGALDLLLAGSGVKSAGAELKGATAEAREAALGERLGLAGMDLTLEEATALESRLAEAELLEVRGRCPAELEELRRYQPEVSRPPEGVGADNKRWLD